MSPIKTEILKFLKNYNDFLSGEDISRELKTSRAAIWKYIKELQKDGYKISATSNRGYKLDNTPDKLYPHEIKDGLSTRILGLNLIYHEKIESTMPEAFRLAMEGSAEGTVVLAENQTKGRGRLGRGWVSPKGKGIYASIVLRPKFSLAEVAKLTLLTAVALSEAIEKTTGLTPQIKWPNDLLIGNKKVAGILTEMNADMDRVRFIIVGIGINVNTPSNSLPEVATSLKIETGQTIPRVKLFQMILVSLEYWYLTAQAKGFDPIIEEWKKRSVTLGKRIRVVEANQILEGEAIDLDAFGGLVIKNDDGKFITRMSGDVTHVR